MPKLRRLAFAPALFLLVSAVVLGCSSTSTPTSTPLQAATPSAAQENAGHEAEQEADHADEQESGHAIDLDATLSGEALAGLQVFRTAGCAACHGQNGEGTNIAPALPGHSENAVRRQARAPVGIMPVFTPDKLTDSQLDNLVSFISGLPGGHGHAKAVDLGAEMEVLELVAQGKTNKELASDLTVSESTVKYHLRNILDKLHLENRAQVIAYAAHRGLGDRDRSHGS